jgi:hypothetical protein
VKDKVLNLAICLRAGHYWNSVLPIKRMARWRWVGSRR